MAPEGTLLEEATREEIEHPPYHIAPVEVWKAYEQLQKAKVRGAPPESKLPILISLIRLATGVTDVLEPFTELVNERFGNWLKQQAQSSPLLLGEDLGEGTQGEGWGEGISKQQRFTPDQLVWLNKIKDDVQENANVVGGTSPWMGKGRTTQEQLSRTPGTTQIAQNAEMTLDDFNYIPFNQEGGLLKARELFGKELEPLISELNGFLIA